MFKTSRYFFLAFAAIGVAFLPACGDRDSVAQSMPPATAAAQGFSLGTPVHIIVADPRGKAVLDRDLPGLTTNPSYSLFSDMSLTQLAAVSNGKITQANLDTLRTDLAQLK